MFLKPLCLAALAHLVVCWPPDRTSQVTTWPTQEFVTEDFKVPRIASSKLGDTAPGYLFFTMGGGGANVTNLMIMTEDGQLVWRPERTRIAATNFHVQTYKGRDVLTYFDGNGDIANTGQWRVLDQSYREIYRVCGAELNITTESRGRCKLNLHETRMSYRSTLLATGHDVRPANLSSVGGPEDGWVVDNVIYEIDIPTEKVLFSWSSWEHRDELPLNLSHNNISHPNLGWRGHDGSSKDSPYDFTHVNSVDLVGDDYLISSRYYWSAIMINRNGSVKWYLEGETGGSFALPSDCHFSFQHDIVVRNATNTSLTISMFDNANDQQTRPPRPSSGLELYLNLSDYSVSLVRRAMDPHVFISTQLTGGYQTLPSGHALANFAIPSFLREFDDDGNVVYAAQLGPVATSDVYRAYKQDWIGRPSTDPKIVAKVDEKTQKTRVWVSWNGATEVKRWVFLAGLTPEVLEWRQEVQKVYFETSVRIPGEMHFLLIEALDAQGELLGTSSVAAVRDEVGGPEMLVQQVPR